jgi:hypothetical protein
VAERPDAAPDWQSRVDEVAPTVVILGGFLTSPFFYRPMRSRLLRRGAAAVVVANTWTLDWLLAGARGLGPIVGRAANAIAKGRELAAASPTAGGAPLLVIGHSAGGILARLLTSPEAFAGRRHGLAPDIGAIVTLGTPHHVDRDQFAGRRVGNVATRFADRVVPGATFAPQTAYVTVASRAVVGRPDGTGRERVGFRVYQGLLHDAGATAIDGDGVVPVRSALLAGARQIVLDDILHGQAAGRPWYGTEPGLDQWWPQAVDAWRDALRVRAAASGPGVAADTNEAESRPSASPPIATD